MIKIRISDLTVGIENRYNQRRRFEDFLSEDEPDFTVSVTDEDLEKESGFGSHRPGYLEYVCIYRKIAEQLPSYGGFVFHGAAVYREGGTFVFTAPSGTGKTTHINLWRSEFPDCWVVNGDKPIIRRCNGQYMVCGTPWRGKEKMGGACDRPLTAICMIQRGETNEIRRVTETEAFESLIHQVYRPNDPQRLIEQLKIMNDCFHRIPIYLLRCNMEPEAAHVSWEAMKENLSR